MPLTGHLLIFAEPEQKMKQHSFELVNPIPLPLSQLAPVPELFTRHSPIHGQPHVSRVIIHTFILTKALGLEDYALKAWAAAYIHDLGRVDDGVSPEHGLYAVGKVQDNPELKTLFEGCGVKEKDWTEIFFAVTHHCLEEVPLDHPCRTLTALLKDADGLDRVRLGGLDPSFLRFPLSVSLIPYAWRLFRNTRDLAKPGQDYFEILWPVARQLLQKET
jgi:hypothetical protein